MIRINLLPRERVRRRPLALRLLVVVVAGAALAALVVATIALNVRNTRVRNEIAERRDKIAVLRPQVERVEALRKQIESARRKALLLKKLEDARVRWDTVLEEVRTLIPKDAWLARLTAADDGSFVVDGYATSYESVARWMVSLKASKMFTGVELTVTEKQRVAGQTVFYYGLTARLVPRQKEAAR